MKTRPFLRRHRGFSLVITMGLMLLLLLLAVGMLSLSTVTMRAAGAERDMATARANARMALILAIGQLQQTAGPDQRITAPASFKSNSGLDANWCGVWVPGSLSDAGLETPVGPKPGQKYFVDQRFADANSAWKSEWFLEALVSNGDNLNGPRTAIGSLSNGEKLQVPTIDVQNPRSPGSLAWWTDDLSQKASIAAGSNARDANAVGLMTAPHFDLELLGGGFKADYFKNAQERDKTISLKTAMMNAGVENVYVDLPAHTRSYGLFTDSIRSGFKADLTRFVESNAPVMGKMASLDLKGLDVNASILPDPFHEKSGPKWGKFRDWFQLPSSNNTLTARIPTQIRPTPGVYCGEGHSIDAINSNQVPVHPMVVDAGFHWDFTQGNASGSEIKVHIYPRLTLWNPYNATLNAGSYVILMPKHVDEGGGLAVEIQSPPPENKKRYERVINNREMFKTGSGVEENYFAFSVEATTFGPGECLVFTPRISSSNGSTQYNASNPSANLLTASQPVGNHNFFLTKAAVVSTHFNFPAKLAAGWVPLRYIAGRADDPVQDPPQSGQFKDPTVYSFVNFNPKPFLFKSAGSSSPTISNLLNSSNFPTLQRLYVNDGGAGKDYHNSPKSAYAAFGKGWNNSSANNGLPWGSYTAGRMPPLLWHYRVRLGRVDETREVTSAGAPQEPPYFAAQFADYNPMATNICRTPSSYYRTSGDLHVGSWLLCKSTWAAYGSASDWSGGYIQGKARGCPFGDPRNYTGLNYALMDVHDPQLPLQSIGRLRNAALSPWSWHPAHIVGSSRLPVISDKNSTAIPAIAAQDNPWLSTKCQLEPVFDDIIQYDDWKKSGGKSVADSLLYDIAYETNHQLWDSCFASSWSIKTTWDGIQKLPNRSYVINPLLSQTAARISEAQDATNADTLAMWLTSYLLVNEGAFNVNSLSQKAWSSFLGGLKGMEREALSGGAISGDHPFARFYKPTNADLDWGGGLALSDEQIETLAKHVTDVIKERGPFLSVADFVNRRLANDPTSQRGALDEALARAQLANPDHVQVSGVPNDAATTVSSNLRAHYDQAKTTLLDGTAGYIEQADLLEPLAGSLNSRGDTFRIRAVGKAVDNSGKVIATAICEAIVMRSPDYVLSASLEDAGGPQQGNSALVPAMVRDPEASNRFVENPKLNVINQKFGRRFEVLGFRWLHNPAEI